MKTREHSLRQRLFVSTSLLLFLTFLLAACAGSTPSGGSVTPTPGKTGTLQTSCPPAGTARAAIMTPLALGKQDTFVYLEGSQPAQQGSYTLKRYTVSTRTTTALLFVPGTPFFSAQISANGQWVILNPFLSGHRAIQLVLLDGQQLQTLYCGDDFGWMQWSPDNNYVAFVDVGTPGSTAKQPSSRTQRMKRWGSLGNLAG